LDTPLFNNKSLGRKLSLQDAREVVDWMASKEGGERAEWVGKEKGRSEKCWVYWRRPEEWASVLEGWVEGTGQRGSVLTFYELVEGDATMSQGMLLLRLWFANQWRLMRYRVPWNGYRIVAKELAGSG
jgi:ESCRT-II complex subunit VPS25